MYLPRKQAADGLGHGAGPVVGILSVAAMDMLTLAGQAPRSPTSPHPFQTQGISGLLPQLKSITKRVHLSEHAGARAAVDAYSLLHKGSYACARELVEDIPTTRWAVLQ